MSTDLPEDHYGTPHGSVIAALRGFARLVRRNEQLHVSGRVRLHRRRDGISVVAEEPATAFRGAWDVTLRAADRLAVVAWGTVDGVVPRIGRVRIDGRDDQGLALPGGPPTLPLSGPGPDLTSHICLRLAATRDPSGRTASLDSYAPEALTVVHVTDLVAQRIVDAIGPDAGLVWHEPLAQLVWTGPRTLVRARMMEYFPLRWRWQPGVGDAPGRQVLW